MTRRQEKWLRIAQKRYSQGLAPWGLCWHVTRVFGWRVRCRFAKLPKGCRMRYHDPGFWWPCGESEPRVLFACLMAAMSDEEYEELLRSAE